MALGLVCLVPLSVMGPLLMAVSVHSTDQQYNKLASVVLLSYGKLVLGCIVRS